MDDVNDDVIWHPKLTQENSTAAWVCVCVCVCVCVVPHLIHKHPVAVFGSQVCFHRLRTHRGDRVNKKDCSEFNQTLICRTRCNISSFFPSASSCMASITEEQLLKHSCFVCLCSHLCHLCLITVCSVWKVHRHKYNQASAAPMMDCPTKMPSDKSFSRRAEKVVCTYQRGRRLPAPLPPCDNPNNMQHPAKDSEALSRQHRGELRTVVWSHCTGKFSCFIPTQSSDS